ncbi:MAG: lysylphosphatidylglycerol synthase domain-containing protein [Thermoplasmatales archaeon]
MSKVLGLALGILLIVILFYSVDMESMIDSFYRISWLKFLVFFLFSFVLIGISALKWLELYRLQGINCSYGDVFLWYFYSYFAGMLLPLGFVGADLARVQLAKKLSGYEGSVSTVLQDRYSGFLVMFFIGSILCFLSWRIPPSIAGVSALIFLAGVVLPILIDVVPILQRFAKLGFIFRDFSTGQIKVLMYSALFYASAVLNIVLGGWVIGFEIKSILDLAALLPLVLLASSLPISPQGLGVQEGFYFFLFQFVGGTKEESLLLALLLRFKVVLLGVASGLVFLIRLWRNKKEII